MSHPRLSDRTLAQAAPAVLRPAYDRAAVRVGVVHFGPGAFHRAHQAFYFDRMLAHSPAWGVAAVSLRSPDLAEALGPQDGLYVLAEREADPTYRIIGSLIEVLTAPRTPEAVFAHLASPDVRVVTSTVTEKGYCLTPAGDLDLAHPDIVHDLSRPAVPKSFPGWLVEGLRRRWSAGVPAFVSIPCDNLSDNGGRLARAVVQLARAQDAPEFAAWIEHHAVFASTMVDSITPATDDALRAQVEAAVGLTDAWPVQREGFVQWVIEDKLGGLALDFAAAGAILTSDVAAFERAKLRLLNGAHSTLAYVGLLKGHETVAQAMADPELSDFVERMMAEDIAPLLPPAPGLDTSAYIAAILTRFRNPAIAHKLSQIAWDGSQKLPFRILETTAEALSAGRSVQRLAAPVAAWMRFLERRAAEGVEIVDPLAATLKDLRGVEAFLALEQVFPAELAANATWRAAVEAAYSQFA
ncbi:mannitol dehydrogenase family protein [Phenylobacterium aquaticum]|uniref:mannitol dehydrogenase family protein n=1 Tax=Phenylobacterium aquaticum TaxID=1763816 RepID=UPI001F5E117E|nr:mannitol dehydrogenase family protein [Phenylobacterium aquaticum]MCI3133816.1 mannitol dehydrogenase family protein [Phenylobacterium aquaticum]